jgi:DNA-binding YbaB/EbfC family protein
MQSVIMLSSTRQASVMFSQYSPSSIGGNCINRHLTATMVFRFETPNANSRSQIQNSARGEVMKFPGGFNIQQMMKQAQIMQEKMQKEMEEMRVDASAGGGVVTVQMKGNHEIVALKIDPEAIKDGDAEMLQDMILAAINEANRKVDEAMKGKLGGMLPPGLGGLFG